MTEQEITLLYQYVEETDSTNTQLKKAAMECAPEGTVLSAGRQTAGRGRSGHIWESPKDVSVYSSLLLYPEKIPVERIPLLTPLAALAVCDAIEQMTGLSAQIKWVNDVLLSEKKVCGILTERILTADGRQAVIVGIGINVHQRKFPCGLTGIATSIDIETARCAGLSDEERDGTPAYQTAAGNADERRNRSKERVTQNALCPVKRRSLTEAVWRRFLFYYTAFLRVQDLGFVRGVYNDRLVNNGRACRVLDPNGVYEGTALGIDEKGRLLIRERSAGTVRAVDAGEVSVRGIYGYV